MATDYTTINSQNLTQTPSVKLPTYQPTPIDPNITQSALASVAGQYEAVNKQLEQVQREQEANRASQNDLSSALMGKTADAQSFQQTAGVDAANNTLMQQATQLADLNAQAQSLQREAQAIPIQVENESMGRGRTAAGVAPIQTARLRDNALRALSIAQQSDVASAALTGSQIRLQAAKDKAQQMVDLKYKPIEDALAIKKEQYELNKDVLASVDKKRTEALSAAIKKEERELEEKKANEKGIADLVMNAAGQGAPEELRVRAAKAKTPMEAVNILGQWAGNYWAIEKTKAELLKARQGTGVGTTTGTYVKGSDKDAEAWASRIANKQAKLSDVPSAMRTRVAVAMGASPEQSAKATELQSEMKTILTRMQGYRGIATGPKAQMFPVASQIDLPFGGKNQTSAALADAERLSALLTTENIAIMKGLGSMSNIEFGNIEKIGSSILGRDKDGNAYFKGDRANYEREIKRLLDDINKVPELAQMSTEAPAIQSKWGQADMQGTSTPLSGMAQKGYINPKSPFGTIDFNLPTKP